MKVDISGIFGILWLSDTRDAWIWGARFWIAASKFPEKICFRKHVDNDWIAQRIATIRWKKSGQPLGMHIKPNG